MLFCEVREPMPTALLIAAAIAAASPALLKTPTQYPIPTSRPGRWCQPSAVRPALKAYQAPQYGRRGAPRPRALRGAVGGAPQL
jgi:hypothetical protein